MLLYLVIVVPPIAEKIDAFSTLKALHESGGILKAVILIFDGINIKKFEETNGGDLVGASDDGQL